MAASRQHSVRPRRENKRCCMAHPGKEVSAGFLKKSESILGVMEVTEQESKKGQLLRKMHMGVCRWESILIRMMRPRFQAAVKT